MTMNLLIPRQCTHFQLQLLVSFEFTSQLVFLNVIFTCLQHQDVESSVPELSGVVDVAVNAASTIGISHTEVYLLEYL